jgi:hypothetical protein
MSGPNQAEFSWMDSKQVFQAAKVYTLKEYQAHLSCLASGPLLYEKTLLYNYWQTWKFIKALFEICQKHNICVLSEDECMRSNAYLKAPPNINRHPGRGAIRYWMMQPSTYKLRMEAREAQGFVQKQWAPKE